LRLDADAATVLGRWDSQIDIVLKNDRTDLREYQLGLTYRKWRTDPFVDRTKKLELIPVRGDILVARVGERWYIAQKGWSPRIERSGERSASFL
jgi:hypothetical protein